MHTNPRERRLMLQCARAFVTAPVEYAFTERERRALAPFFSNPDKRVFLFFGLPESVAATLLAMYSRQKNPRGLRGHFVDHLVPLLMLNSSDEAKTGHNAEWKVYQREFKERGFRTLDQICDGSDVWSRYFESFIAAAGDPEYWRIIADSGRIKSFKEEHIDTYGHNSIQRPARLLLCAEQVSIQAAKAFEETWPGTAFIELSTRYVDFSKKSQYPVWDEIACVDPDLAQWVRFNIEEHASEYLRLMGEKFDGPFPSFLRTWAASRVPDEADRKSGVIGEACDVLGNLLPCSTLTELGMAVSGEAVGSLFKNLRLQATPECYALAELIEDEIKRSGNSYFLRHTEPTPWEEATAEYLPPVKNQFFDSVGDVQTELRILAAFGEKVFSPHAIERCFRSRIAKLRTVPRGEHDTLPQQFRVVSVMAQSVMSYRGWRDLQRQSLSVHFRSRVTPRIGFYHYPKVRCVDLDEAFAAAHDRDRELYRVMSIACVPDQLMEYAMAMGNLVSFSITSDLRQAEFCNWQRSKWGVNDEVRAVFLAIEDHLRRAYWWWGALSRADRTPHFVFARGKTPVVLR